MPSITGLSPARRRPGWIDLELDAASSFPLPERVVREADLRVGDALPPAGIAALREKAKRVEAIDVALRYLSYRPRSRVETTRHLRRKGYAEAAVSAAIQYCIERRLLDDGAYAAAYARDRIRLRPRSPALIESELRGRGVSEGDARAGIAGAFHEEGVDENTLLERVARKFFGRLRGEAPADAERRLFGHLLRRGFGRSEASRMTRRLLSEVAEFQSEERTTPGRRGPNGQR